MKMKHLKNPARIAEVGFEPHDLEVMGLARTPGSSTPLYLRWHARAFKVWGF